MKITRGTTPTVSLTVTDYEIKATDSIYMYFSQDDKMRFKKVSPEEVKVEGNVVRAMLTQEDTFKLKKDKKVKIRFRLKTESGIVTASGEIYADVDDVDDNDEVI